MRVVCKSALGDAIPKTRRYLGEEDQTSYFPLVVGDEYPVHALLFIHDRIDFLVRPPSQTPFWVPGDLFDLVDTKVPEGWELRITVLSSEYRALSDTFGISCVMGYPLLVNEFQHYVGLAEGEAGEVQRFMENLARL